MLKIKVITYQPVKIDREKLVTLAEAVRITGMSKQGIVSAMERGRLTEIIDDTKTYHGHRLYVRSEIENLRIS
jgi:hypothetical protein